MSPRPPSSSSPAKASLSKPSDAISCRLWLIESVEAGLGCGKSTPTLVGALLPLSEFPASPLIPVVLRIDSIATFH